MDPARVAYSPSRDMDDMAHILIVVQGPAARLRESVKTTTVNQG